MLKIKVPYTISTHIWPFANVYATSRLKEMEHYPLKLPAGLQVIVMTKR
jgi:hypothetical protein